MDDFLFTEGQRVKAKTTGEIGTVVRCDRDPTTNAPFYRVRFADGTVIPIPESELWPA
jgi:hypothetical protein